MGKVVLGKQMLNVRNAYEHEKFDTKVDDEMEYTNPNASPIPNFPDVPFSIRQELLSLPCLYALTRTPDPDPKLIKVDAETGYKTVSILAVPICDNSGEVIRVWGYG